MIPRDEYLLAADRVHEDLIDVLAKWMRNEKGNLDSFLTNPTEHVLYNPFVIPDTVALMQRSALLEQAVQALTVISDYKKGLATRGQRDYALDQIPYVLFVRLLDWMQARYDDFIRTTTSSNVGAPISEYSGLITFDIEAYLAQMQKYAEAIEGAKVIIQYKKEQLVPVEPPVEETPPEE